MWYGQDRDPTDAPQLLAIPRCDRARAHTRRQGIHVEPRVPGQSGALNESFSDIFGIIIANWDPKDPTGTWAAGRGSSERAWVRVVCHFATWPIQPSPAIPII